MPGPAPARSEDLARPRERKGGDVQSVTTGQLREVTIPHKNQEWHPIAIRLWDGLKTSGQADFFQNSDWAFAYSLMDDLSYYKSASRRSSQMLQSIYSALERLLVTEADRRRVRIELSAPEPEGQPAAVLAIAAYRAELDEDDDEEEALD